MKEQEFVIEPIELDDAQIDGFRGGTTSIPCIGIVIATVTACLDKTAVGSCGFGTRGCC